MNEFTTSLKDDNRTTQKYVCRKLAIFLLEIAMVILIVYTFLGLFGVSLTGFTEVFLCASVMLLSSLAVCCVLAVVSFRIKSVYVLSLCCIVISYFSHNSGLTYLFSTFITVNLLLLFRYVHPPKLLWKSMFAVLVLIVVLVLLFAPQFKQSSDTDKFLNLNTNTSGYILFIFFFITIFYASEFKVGSVKGCVFGIVAVGTFVAQLRYGGRSSMLGDVLVLLCIILKKYIENMSPRKVKRTIFALSVFSIVFTYLYAVVLFKAVGHGNWFFMGKDIFTGRQVIWNDAFDQLNGHLFLGLGNRLRSMAINGDTSGFTNVHNQMLGYVVTFGFVGFIPFLFLFSDVSSLYGRRSAMMVSFILVLSIMAYFDTIIYSVDNAKYNCLALVVIAGMSMPDVRKCKGNKRKNLKRNIKFSNKEKRGCLKQFTTVGLEERKNPKL